MEFIPELKVVAGGVELGGAVFKALLAIEVSGSFKKALAGVPYATLWNLVARAELGVPLGEAPGYFNVARTHEEAAAKVAV